MQDCSGFLGKGTWYKGNLHSHTTVSDGALTPEESVQLYKSKGYNFLCLSEHDIYTDFGSQYNDAAFLILPGVECSATLYKSETAGKRQRLKVHHIHGILGTTEMQNNAVDGLFTHMQAVPPLTYAGQWPGAAAAQEMVDMLQRHGCITTYNHPIWSRVEGAEFCHTRGLWAMEIFNYNTVQESGTGYSVSHWDDMLRAGTRIHAFASDDNHNGGLFEDSGGGWICLQAPALTHDALITALLVGNYYSSSGPEIYDWGVQDGVVQVQCSPVQRVNFVCGNYVNDGFTALGKAYEDSLTQAHFRLKGHERYVRIECVDMFGRTAWSNPLYFE